MGQFSVEISGLPGSDLSGNQQPATPTRTSTTSALGLSPPSKTLQPDGKCRRIMAVYMSIYSAERTGRRGASAMIAGRDSEALELRRPLFDKRQGRRLVVFGHHRPDHVDGLGVEDVGEGAVAGDVKVTPSCSRPRWWADIVVAGGVLNRAHHAPRQLVAESVLLFGSIESDRADVPVVSDLHNFTHQSAFLVLKSRFYPCNQTRS